MAHEDRAPRAGVARRRADPVLVTGLLLVLLAAAALRLVNLGGNLPQVVAADEPTVVQRALSIEDGDLTPDDWDWPPLAMEVMAGAAAVARLVTTVDLDADGRLYLLGRAVFATVSLATVALAGLLGAAAARHRRDRRLVAWGAAALTAVSYLSVRLGRQVHPEHLQLALVLGSLLATLRYDRDPRRWHPLAAAGVLAGLAGATKYLGLLAALPAAAAALWPRDGDRPATGRPARHVGLVAGTAAAGFALGAPGAVLAPAGLVDGVRFQLGHQAGGHLGYDGVGNGWWFHLTESLPGNWGWPVTVLAVAGLALAVVRGSREERLVAAFVVPVLGLIGLTRVRFPHYVLVAVPLLAVLAAGTAVRLARALPRPAPGWLPAVAVAALVATTGPTLLDDLRLVRAAGTTDTRILAAAAVGRLPGPVWSERYAPSRPGAELVADFGNHPEVLECRCFALISSYMEDRYRRRPRRYASQVAVYDAMRARGRVVDVVRPPVALDYDWDLLPQWGLRRLPWRGRTAATGPTVTIVDLRGPLTPGLLGCD